MTTIIFTCFIRRGWSEIILYTVIRVTCYMCSINSNATLSQNSRNSKFPRNKLYFVLRFKTKILNYFLQDIFYGIYVVRRKCLSSEVSFVKVFRQKCFSSKRVSFVTKGVFRQKRRSIISHKKLQEKNCKIRPV